MIEINNLIISKNSNLKEGLKTLNDNGCGICFVLDKKKLVGVITDGDIRRAILAGSNLSTNISDIMNKDFISLPVSSSQKLIRKTFSKDLKIIPLCDEKGNLVDFADLYKSHRIPILEPNLSGNELSYVQDCISSNWISSQGKFVNEFEDIFSKMHSPYQALAVSNGTVALHLALHSLGIKKNDEVIVPDITFAASINSILYCNATPVLCEIDKITWCIKLEALEKLITPRTKAIMPVHLFGHPSNMEIISRFAQKNKLLIIEDCAEALGSEYNKKLVGTFGDASTFSFFGNKTISTGEGGMIIFKDKKIYEKAKILRDHGMSPKKRYWHEQVGFNYRLTNIQAAIGVAQMERLDEFISRKIKLASIYSQELKNIEYICQLPSSSSNIIHSNWLYTILIDKSFDREKILQYLQNLGIDARPSFYSLHTMPPYKKYPRSRSLINSLNFSKSAISLPSSFSLLDYEIEFIINSLKEFNYQ